ncbi:hypothetical protein RQP46_005021 [Phenoliferia psychrophenolica]
MARGNQRENDREKAQKKLAAQNKGNKESGSSLRAKQEASAAIMREKNRLADEKKANPPPPVAEGAKVAVPPKKADAPKKS